MNAADQIYTGVFGFYVKKIGAQYGVFDASGYFFDKFDDKADAIERCQTLDEAELEARDE